MAQLTLPSPPVSLTYNFAVNTISASASDSPIIYLAQSRSIYIKPMGKDRIMVELMVLGSKCQSLKMMYISKYNSLNTLREKMYCTVHVGHCSAMTSYTSIDIPDPAEVKRVELGVRCIYDKNRHSSCLSAKKYVGWNYSTGFVKREQFCHVSTIIEQF